jgi:2-oxoglutarate ferredoxin oxidoreductase subunit delta
MNPLLVRRPGAPSPLRLPANATVRYEQGEASLTVRRTYCKGCRLCVDACPADVLRLDADDLVYVTDIARCLFCGACAGRCPDFVFLVDRG